MHPMWLRSATPLGDVTIVRFGDAITALAFDETARPGALSPLGREDEDDTLLQRAAAELEDYFAGALVRFTVPLAPQGTAFQRTVWNALLHVPYGGTVSYRELALRIGHPSAVRAVGAALGRNPICIAVPCHRVIGAHGDLTGYAGGLERKRALLALEAAAALARQRVAA